MDLSKYSSYMLLQPSDLYKAQRMVERVTRYHGEDYEAMVQELEETLHGQTLEYAMALYEEAVSKTMEYMGVKISFNGSTFSAPTVGIYGVKSKPEIKAAVKEKVLKRNSQQNEEVEQIDEISANLALTASQKADEMRRRAAISGDKETAAKKSAQASRLYKGVGPRRAKERMGEALDPVGQEDADVDNDGKKNTKSDKYLKNRRRTISKAIAAKEEFEIEMLVDYFVTEQIAESESELDDIMYNIDEEHVEYFLEKAMQLKGKKKGDVIINPKVDDVKEQAEGGNDQVVMRNQKMMMAKKHQMDRQKMQLKKQGKLNVNAEEFEYEIDEATAMAKRGHDETAIRNKIAKSTGGGKSADRATALADKPTYGNDKAAKQRQDLARKQRGDFRKTTSSSPGLHGYGHKSDDPKVKAKQAARGAQRGALTPNEKKSLNREEYVVEVDYSGRPAAADPASEKEKKYPTFAELKAKLAQAGDPAKGIPASTQLPQTSLKKEEVEDLDELYKGKHGQSEKEYQDSRSDGGKMVSGDSKRSGAAYSSRAVKNTGPNPAGGSKKPQGQGRMTSGARADLQYRKANMMKKEEIENVSEEGADRLKDRRMERGGVDGNTRYNRPPAKKLSNAELGIDPKAKTAYQKQNAGKSALDIVRANIEKKHGKGSIMDTKKK